MGTKLLLQVIKAIIIQSLIPGVDYMFLPRNVLEWNIVFCFAIQKFKIRENTFPRSVKSANSRSHCSSRKCWTYTLNDFSLALWRSRNEEDLFRVSKIDTVQRCIHLLKNVPRYGGHLLKGLYAGTVWCFQNGKVQQ